MSDAATARGGTAKLVFTSALVAAVAVFVAAVIGSIHKSPGIGGILSGIFAGLFGGLLVMAGGAWMATKLAPKSAPAPAQSLLGEQLAAGLADVLTELEKTRVDLYTEAMERAKWRVPAGAVAGAAWWLRDQFETDPSGLFGLLMFVGIGAVAGYFWATASNSAKYTRLYKDKVLPKLAAGFGDISYRQAVPPDLEQLRREHVFEDFDESSATDELFGTYHGLDISILELSLHKRNGKNRRSVFNGLIAQITLPRGLKGTTAIIADEGVIGTVRDWMQSGPGTRVRVEDPEFEAGWQVYGTDQIGARALLTPAFMERFKALGQRAGFGKPLALAVDNRLLLALPSWSGALFKLPELSKPAANRELLVALHDAIGALLQTVDAVVDLDQTSRARVGRRTD
ncbi:DUF3137 domain-containing protein [Glacieibacterium frigidum]|uniref:DUF3137 domain-containing protein n=1 Tax=Glacieibacterium frigidum TaxID=2593303 RepID=A0A552UAB7_9SPHN|nr:DUF3137 domain-containing protein [Glacieibacterium frigidum]TRW15165.1 DUF3137 domain-containing protein [Glacieibacterium frigidum]